MLEIILLDGSRMGAHVTWPLKSGVDLLNLLSIFQKSNIFSKKCLKLVEFGNIC